MRLYTVQENDVIERLAAGETHFQAWERSAAVTGTPRDLEGVRHKEAYEFIAKEFPHRTNLPMTGAPIFCFRDRESVLQFSDVGKPSGLLTLEVPDSQVLLHNYDFWAKTILWGWCGEHDIIDCPNPECKENSWRAQGFETPEDIRRQQAILNRIEPEWVVRN